MAEELRNIIRGIPEGGGNFNPEKMESRWLGLAEKRDRRKNLTETPAQRIARRKAEIAQEKHDHAQRMLRQEQNEKARESDFYAQYMESLVENIRKLEQMKELAARRDEAWLEKGRIRAQLMRDRPFWPQEVESAFEERHGADAVENIGLGRPEGFTEWQQSELDRRKKELSRMSREYQKHQNQFRLPVIPRDE